MQVTALRMTTDEAATALRVKPETVRRHARRRWLHAITDSGETGPGQVLYFDPAEVEAFARGGKPAAEAYRAGRDRKPIPVRRGRAGK